MTRFQPTVEALDLRALPAMLIASPEMALASPPPATVRIETTSADGGFMPQQTETVVAKVKFQDIHFTQSVSKSSTQLMQ